MFFFGECAFTYVYMYICLYMSICLYILRIYIFFSSSTSSRPGLTTRTVSELAESKASSGPSTATSSSRSRLPSASAAKTGRRRGLPGMILFFFFSICCVVLPANRECIVYIRCDLIGSFSYLWCFVPCVPHHPVFVFVPRNSYVCSLNDGARVNGSCIFFVWAF